VYGVCQWIVLYRRNSSVERKLAYVNLGCAGFVGFGVVTNIGEALIDEQPFNVSLMLWLAIIGGTVLAYLIACGSCRLRWTRESGKHVGARLPHDGT
jgi:hypothetical protein